MDTNLSASLHEGIKSLYQDNFLTDVIIRVEDQTFPCHRLVLSAMSPYFRSMFTNSFQDKEMEDVVLQSIKPEIFQCILQYIYYSKESSINEGNVQDILATANMFLIDFIVNKCETFLSERINSKNALNVWRLAETLSRVKLAQLSKDFILREFESVSREDEFLDLKTSEVVEIIKDQSLYVANEEIVGDAVFRWVFADEESRKCHIYDVLQHVRLPLTRPKYVFSLSKKHPFLYDNLEIIKLLDEAKYFHCENDKHNNLSKRSVHRNCSETANGMIFVRGDFVQLYSFQDQKWVDASSLPRKVGILFATCTHGNSFYISGGDVNWSGEMFEYIAFKNCWVLLPKLGNVRYRHALVADSEMIYLVGGTYGTEAFSSDVTSYNIKEKVYQHIGHLDTPIRSMDAVLVEDNIYIFGGKMDDITGKSKIIQCFDLSRNQGSRIKSELFVDVTFTGATVVNDSVYLVGGDGNLMEWTDGKLRGSHACNISRTETNTNHTLKVSMCYHDERLYICTGNKTEINSVHVGSGEKRTLNCGSCEATSYLCAVGTICLPKKHFK